MLHLSLFLEIFKETISSFRVCKFLYFWHAAFKGKIMEGQFARKDYIQVNHESLVMLEMKRIMFVQ